MSFCVLFGPSAPTVGLWALIVLVVVTAVATVLSNAISKSMAVQRV